jgi:excisionase family DNA binding protein
MSVIPKKPDPDKEILTPGEACWFIGRSWNTVRALVKAGVIPAKKMGKRYLFLKSEVVNCLK